MTAALFPIDGELDKGGVSWRLGSAVEANELLAARHYLGPLANGARLTVVGEKAGEPVAAMMWRHPTTRRLPQEWLELSRWCLTPDAGENAGSRMHRAAVRLIRRHLPRVTTLISYSDPEHGHTGALYRACNWQWAPTWHRLRPPPTGNGDWGTGRQSVKDRWVFCIARDAERADALRIEDLAAIRSWCMNATETERRWAARSLNLSIDVQFEAFPGEEGAADDQSLPRDVVNRSVGPVDSDGPADHGAEHVAGVGLVPGELHGRTVAEATDAMLFGGAA